ncbi:MAG: hypothetical protein ACE5HB_10980 [Terriglobia bacterium]
MPVFGFNTDVKVGKLLFHVQTEDRGAGNPVLDTTIYVKGRVLAKRGTPYQDFLASPDFNEAELHAMLEKQHKEIIDEVRTGTLPELALLPQQAEAGGLHVQLTNPATFLRGTTASLEVVVTEGKENKPVPRATVRVLLHTGTPNPVSFETATDPAGKATLQFPLPRLGPGGAEMILQASTPSAQDEIKYTLRTKPKEA